MKTFRQLPHYLVPGSASKQGVQVEHAAGNPTPNASEHFFPEIDVQMPVLLPIATQVADIVGYTAGGRGWLRGTPRLSCKSVPCSSLPIILFHISVLDIPLKEPSLCKFKNRVHYQVKLFHFYMVSAVECDIKP